MHGMIGAMTPEAILEDLVLGQTCLAERREYDWNFHFGQGRNLGVGGRWRIVTEKGIALADQDDGHQFGHPQAVDGEALANKLLSSQRAEAVSVDQLTADLRITFGGGVRLDIFNNSSGYEAWQANLDPTEGDGVALIGIGGGGLTIWPS